MAAFGPHIMRARDNATATAARAATPGPAEIEISCDNGIHQREKIYLTKIRGREIFYRDSLPPSPGYLTFDDPTHTYHYVGRKLTSVSSLLSKYKRPFNANYWAAKKAKERGCSPQDILREWDAKRDASTAKGHAIHLIAEEIAKFGEIHGTETIAAARGIYRNHFDSICNFYSRPTISPVAAERRVCSPSVGVAGTIDLIADFAGCCRLILDWKTNASIDRENAYGNMKRPLTHLPDCNFYHYALQLSIYRWILETEYREQIDAAYLIHLPDYGGYEVIPVPYLRAEAEAILFAA